MDNETNQLVIDKQTDKNNKTFLSIIKSLLNDQDFIQKSSASITVILELYRVLVSSFLILFVPQKCDDHVCSYSENMVLENDLYSSGLVINFFTMFVLFTMYIIEIKRENRLISYLEVNKEVPCDNETVENALKHLPDNKRNAILYLDKWYQRLGYTSMLTYMVNVILSGFVVYSYYLDGQTTTTFITNVLFMLAKLGDVYLTVNTEKNIFYSAYLKSKVQFNDVDPDKYTNFGMQIIPDNLEKNNHNNSNDSDYDSDYGSEPCIIYIDNNNNNNNNNDNNNNDNNNNDNNNNNNDNNNNDNNNNNNDNNNNDNNNNNNDNNNNDNNNDNNDNNDTNNLV